MVVIVIFMALLRPRILEVRRVGNRVSMSAWLSDARSANVAHIFDTGLPFANLLELPSSLRDRVEINPEDPNHAVGYGYDVEYEYSLSEWPPSFHFEACPRYPGRTGSKCLSVSYPSSSMSASATADLKVAAAAPAQGDGDVIEWEHPDAEQGRRDALKESALEGLKLLGELAGFLDSEEKKQALMMMSDPEEGSKVFSVLDRNGDNTVTGDELSGHPDPLVDLALQRVVVGPLKLGAAGEDTTAFGVSEDEVDFDLLALRLYPTYHDLCDLFESFVDAPKTGKSFCAKIEAAAAADARGRPHVAVNNLEAAKRQVSAQWGKALDETEADTTLNLIELLIADLQSLVAEND